MKYYSITGMLLTYFTSSVQTSAGEFKISALVIEKTIEFPSGILKETRRLTI